MLKRFYSFALVLLCSLMTAFADDATYSPTLDVNFRTAAGNTSWQTVKNAAEEGNNDYELCYANGFFALQKYTVADLQNATKLVLTLTVGKYSGVDAVKLWSIANTTWTAESLPEDFLGQVETAIGVAPRATEGTTNTPLVSGAKVANSDPAKATFTISGTALATIKANAAEDGTFTLLLTNNDLTNSKNQRSYLSVNSANDEANRPSLVATIETPSVVNKTTGVGYSTLEEAFNAAVAAETDAELEVIEDQTLSKRLTLNKAISITITPTKDITIKGQKNAMWFLINESNATLKLGSADHKITLDGIGDDRSSFSNVDVTRNEKGSKMYLTNIEFKDFTCGANHLIGSKDAGYNFYLENITFNNCSSTDALISSLRKANDAIYFKGFLNVESCTGNTIYTVRRLRMGDPDGSTIYSDFTASNLITIAWGGDFAEGTNVIVKVPASAFEKFQLVSDEWTLARNANNGDLYMTKPAEPTVKIGDKGYADLGAALAAVQDGETITLLEDQEMSSRVNVKNMSITIDGDGKNIKRAAGYANGMLFLTQKADEGNTTALTLQNVTIDGQSVEATAAVMEASNGGTTTLKNVTFKNCKNVHETNVDAAIVVNKGGGVLNIDGVTFTDCSATKELIFVGTNNVTLAGTNTIASMLVEKNNSLTAKEASATAPIALVTDDNRTFGVIVAGGKAADFTAAAVRLSQQGDDLWAMLTKANNYTHPGLLHTAADITRVQGNLEAEPFKSAYNALATASDGSAAGASEYLKRMDEGNWGPHGKIEQNADYNNFNHAATDARLAYHLALRYQLKNYAPVADKAIAILNDWAKNNKGFYRKSGYKNSIPDPNEYLMTIQAYQFANAAELLRGYEGWKADDQTTFKNWMRETFADVAVVFLTNHHDAKLSHYWANWDLAALTAIYSVGVLCDDAALVDFALNYVSNGEGMGSAANAVPFTHQDPDSEETLAQCQESGRDQGHSTLDVTLMGALCQMAQNQGTDLFTTYKALEMAEYVGKYNLKDANGDFVYTETKVPFTAYDNGEYQHSAISDAQRGTERNCWELFLAYAKKNEKAAAYTEGWVKYLRAKNAYGEGAATSTDELGFGTLMFATPNDIATAIRTIKGEEAGMENGSIFNLNGQRVANPSKGLYIINGRKAIMK